MGGPAIVYRGMQLWISERHRFIFMRYQKVASTTSMVLARMYGANMLYQGERWDGKLPQKYAAFFKFAFVRDPLHRLISSYNFRRPGECRPPLPRCIPDPQGRSKWSLPGGGQRPAPLRERALARFATDIEAGVATCAHMDVHFHPQMPWLVQPDGSPRQLDFIGVTDGPVYALGWKAISLALNLKPPVTDGVIANATRTTMRAGRAEAAIPKDQRGLLVSARNLSDKTAFQICKLYAADYTCLRAIGAPLDSRCSASVTGDGASAATSRRRRLRAALEGATGVPGRRE